MQIACQTKLKLCQSPLHPNRICVFIYNTSRARAAKARSIWGSGNNACPDDIPACSSKLQSAFRTWGMLRCKRQALVYDILPSTTAVFSYARESRKLSANEQFFVGPQTGVSLFQTIQINKGVSFIAANKVYTSTNKTTIV